MVLSEVEQQRAYREAREILKLGQKWQQLMPGEKRPNFERAAKEVLRRALGHQVQKNVEKLDIHGGTMAQHTPREAHLVERYLKSGTVHPDVLHSFVHGDVHTDPEEADLRPARLRQHYPGHWHPGTGTFVDGHQDREVVNQIRRAPRCRAATKRCTKIQ